MPGPSGRCTLWERGGETLQAEGAWTVTLSVSAVHEKGKAPARSPEPACHQGHVRETTRGRDWRL